MKNRSFSMVSFRSVFGSALALSVLAGGCSPKQKADSGTRTGSSPAAASVVGEGNMSQEARDLVALVSGVKSKFQILSLVAEARKEVDDPAFASKPADYRLYQTLLSSLHASRGLLYRLQTVFTRANGIGDGTDPVHSMFLSVARNSASALTLMSPTAQWRAGFAYFAEPLAPTEAVKRAQGLNAEALEGVDPIGPDSQFKNIQQAQAFVCSEMLAEATAFRNRLASFQFSNAGPGLNNQVVFDLKGAMGSFRSNPDGDAETPVNADAIDPLNRFILVGPAEVKAMTAAVSMGLHNMRVFCAYEQDGFFELAEQMGRFFATDRGIAPFTQVEGLTAKKRLEMFQKVRQQKSKFMTLRGEGGAFLKDALGDLERAVKDTADSWEQVQANASNANAGLLALNPMRILPWDRFTKSNLESIKALVASEGAYPLTSTITNETVKVNLRAFYLEPRQDLRDYMPMDNAFEDKRQLEEVIAVAGGERKVTFKNYFHGRPLAWSGAVYKAYFPEVAVKDGKADIRPAVRVLSQTWGGWIVSGPLAGFAF